MILNTSCSLLTKVGSIHLYIDFFGWYSFLMIAGVLILNIAFSYLCQLISTKKYFKRLKMVHERDLPEGKSTTHLQKLFTSYTNLFVLSRTFGSIRKISTSLFLHTNPLIQETRLCRVSQKKCSFSRGFIFLGPPVEDIALTNKKGN